jgi:hypothetical protein
MASSNKKSKLDDLLGADIPQGIMKRGKGLHTPMDTDPNTTEQAQERTNAESHNNTNAQAHERTNAPVRISRGYKFREDLIKEYKRLALDEGKHLYEVMEEALERYLEQKRTNANV